MMHARPAWLHGRFAICHSFQSCSNVLSAIRYSHLSMLTRYCRSISQHTDVDSLLTMHSQNCRLLWPHQCTWFWSRQPCCVGFSRHDCCVWDCGPRYSFTTFATIIRDNRQSTGLVYFVSVWQTSVCTDQRYAVSKLSCATRRSTRIRPRTIAVHLVCCWDSRQTWLRFPFLYRWCPAVSFLSSWWLCRMCQVSLSLHWRHQRLDGLKPVDDESSEDRRSMVLDTTTATRLTPAKTTVQPSTSVCNLGVLFDADLSLKAHINQLTARCYCCLRCIKSCRRALTRRSAVTVMNSLTVTRLDYCNSLLAGCNKQLINKLQSVLNCAVRVIFGGNCRDHITPLLLNNLHWLRVRERITFKLCLLVYKVMNGPAQSFIKELCVPVTTVATRSALQPVVTSSFHAPGANSATVHSPLLVWLCGTVCLWTSKLHRHHLHLRTCLKCICFRCPTICSNC